MKDLALLLIEVNEVPASPFLQLAKVTVDSSSTLWLISHPFQFCVISKLTEGKLCQSILIQNIN